MRILIRLRNVIPMLLAIYILLWMFGGLADFFPSLQRIYAYIIFVIWFGLSCISKPSFFNRMIKTGWPLYLLLFINTIGYIVFPSAHVTTNLTVFMYLFVVQAIFIYYSSSDLKHERNIIFLVLMINILICGIITFFKLQANPNLSRFLGTGLQRYEEIVTSLDAMDGTTYSIISIKGVGSYGYFYAIPFLLVIFLYGAKESKKTTRFLYLMGILFILILCIKASFVTAMILSMAIIGIMLLDNLFPKKSECFILYAILGITIFVLVFTGIVPYTLKQISFYIKNVVIQTRVISIADFLQGDFDYENNDLATRIFLSVRSIKTFLSNPFIGTLGSTTSGKVGGHATAFDMLAIYGLPGILFFIFLKNSCNLCMLFSCRKEIISLGIKYLIMILFLNNCLYAQIFIGLFIILPFGSQFIRSKQAYN